eukprot:1172042-Prymnesium_polylepis.3
MLGTSNRNGAWWPERWWRAGISWQECRVLLDQRFEQVRTAHARAQIDERAGQCMRLRTRTAPTSSTST